MPTRKAPEAITLDESDPIEKALANMARTSRAKAADYAVDGTQFSNFYRTSDRIRIPGFGAVESAHFNVVQKAERIAALRENGRLDDPANEAVGDTYLDLAVYATLTYAIWLEQQ